MTRNERMLIAIERGYSITKEGGILYKGVPRRVRANAKGYLEFAVRINPPGISKSRSIPVHRMQAYFKYGDILFKEGILVRHLNGNKKDNSFKNIGIGTAKDNAQDVPKEQRKASAKVATLAILKHNHSEIRKAHENGLSYKEIMTRFNISSKGTVGYIIRSSKGVLDQ